MDKKNRLFRKSRFGGFNKDDVIDYIEKMKNDFFEYQSDVEKTLAELRNKVTELENENAKLSASFTDSKEIKNELQDVYPIDGINEATDHLKMVADEICDSLIEFLDKLNESSFTVSIETPLQGEQQNSESQKVSEKNEAVVSNVLDSVFSNEKTEGKKKSDDLKLESVLPSYLFE